MIVVLTTPRSGSTFICNHIANEYGYNYLGEAFNFNYKKSNSDLLSMVDYYQNKNNILLKIFPNNINAVVLNGCVKKAEKVYIHSRKDFNAQCKSFYISITTDTWHASTLDQRYIKYDADVYERYQQYLMRSYIEIKRIMAQLKNVEISYLEDFYKTEHKYQQPVVWDTEPPLIDFDIEKLFND